MGKNKQALDAAVAIPEPLVTEAIARAQLPTEHITEAQLPEGGGSYLVSAENGLNLRSGPSLQYPVRAVLPCGSVVQCSALPDWAEVSGWAAVLAGELGGWVNTHHLTQVE